MKNVVIHYKNLILLLLCISGSIHGISQPSKIDSLLSLIRPTPSDTMDAKNMIYLSMELFYHSSFDSALHYAIQARKLSEKLNYRRGVGNALLASGYAYRLKGSYEAAIKDFKEALLIFNEIHDSLNLGRSHNFLAQTYQNLSEDDQALEHLQLALNYVRKAGYKPGLSVIYLDIGINYFNRGSYEVALEYYLKSLRISESIHAASKIAMGLNNIGMVYERMGDYDKALEYYEQCLELTETNGITSKLALALINTGAIYSLTYNFEKAEENLLKGLKIVQENGDKEYECHALWNLGSFFEKKGMYHDAEAYYKKSIAIGREINNPKFLLNPLTDIGNLFLKQGKYEMANDYAVQIHSLAKAHDLKPALKDCFLFYSNLDSARGDFKAAFYWYKQYTRLNDSLFNERKEAKIIYLQELYDRERKAAMSETPGVSSVKNTRGLFSTFQVDTILLLSFLILFAGAFITSIVLYTKLRIKSRQLINDQVNH